MIKLEITITELQDGSISMETDEWTQGDVSLNEERYAGAIVGTIEAMNDSMDEADLERLEREMAAELSYVEIEQPCVDPPELEERE